MRIFIAGATGAVGRRRRVPAWLARLLVGEAGVSLMMRIRGASNAKARRELAWEPIYPSWRQGFRSGLGSATSLRGTAGPRR